MAHVDEGAHGRGTGRRGHAGRELRSARIESLRAIAALGVLVGHEFVVARGLRFDSYLDRVILGGGFGVDLFFALTGYLLFWPFARRLSGTGRGSTCAATRSTARCASCPSTTSWSSSCSCCRRAGVRSGSGRASSPSPRPLRTARCCRSTAWSGLRSSSSLKQVLVGTLVCLAVAFVSYRLVEAPFLRLRKRWEGGPRRITAEPPPGWREESRPTEAAGSPVAPA